MQTRRSLATALALALAILWTFTGVVARGDPERIVITNGVAPAQVEIEPGTTVTWHNHDDERHRMRSKDGSVRFDSKNLEPGDSFSFTFTVEGSYPYYDHRDRDDADYFGVVVVGGAALDPDAPLPETGSVSVIDKSFRPGSLAVATGGTVEWSNDDDEAHTVTATDQAFDSGIMNGGTSFSQTFAQPGSYPYFCLIHPEMRGTITVADPAEPVPGKPASGEQGTDPTVPDLDAALDSLDIEAATGATVSTIDRAFQPDAVEVGVGEAVTWTNDDTEGHTVTANDGSFNSGIMTIGDEYAMTFEAPGTVDYFCAIHPEMTGTITVSEPAA